MPRRVPGNKAKVVGQKLPFKQNDIWVIRTRLDLEHRTRELALFNLAIDSKLCGCNLLQLGINDVCDGERVATRAIVMQHKTKRPVRFEITAAGRSVRAKPGGFTSIDGRALNDGSRPRSATNSEKPPRRARVEAAAARNARGTHPGVRFDPVKQRAIRTRRKSDSG
jgi:hypothetical protein